MTWTKKTIPQIPRECKMMLKRNSNIFQKNCEKWSQTDPKKAVLLPYVDCENVQFCITDGDELNLKLSENQKTYFFHSPKGALKEAEKWFAHLNLSDIPLLYVYGVGLGYYYQAAQAWLHENPSHRLVFIEDNLAVIHRLFETDLGYQIVHDPQVQLHFFEGMEKSKELFNILYWNFFLTTLHVSALGLYTKLKSHVFEELQHKIHYDASLKNSLLVEYLNYGVGFFKNFYPNMLCLEGAFLADDLLGKFKNVPAIICGAGPSLEKNLPVLGKLLNKALVFAGGSALNALNKADLQPHFGAGIDPNAPQYDRLSTNTAFEVPFFYRNRLLHQAFKTLHGPRLYVTGSGGYDISYLFEDSLEIESKPLEEGHNVVNFCLEIAYALGCNPIIFVGMDLAYTGMKAYASGVVEDNTVDVKTLTRKNHIDQAALLKQDIYGKPIYTLWKWISEAEWIGDFAKTHPESIVINATEGGLGFPGISNMDLKNVANQYLQEEYDFSGMIHSAVLNCTLPQVKTKKVRSLMEKLEKSLQRCIEDLSVLIEESEEMKRRIKKDKKVPFPQQTGRASLYESDLSEEAGYRYVLHIFNEAYTRVLNRELQALHTTSKRPSEVKQTLGKIDILIKRFTFLKDVSRINHELIKMALKNQMPQFPCSVMHRPGPVTAKQRKIKGKIQGDSLYYAGDHLLSRTHFEKGLQVGAAELFYSDGQLYSLQHFSQGVRHGKQLFYYPDGTLKTFLEYNQGKLLKAQLFHPDGTLKKEL